VGSTRKICGTLFHHKRFRDLGNSLYLFKDVREGFSDERLPPTPLEKFQLSMLA